MSLSASPCGGAQIEADGVRFRVWAPRRREVVVKFESGEPPVRLVPQPDGFFSGRSDRAAAVSLYRFELDGAGPYPDPYSRFQPEGPHGPSMVIDPGAYRWKDAGWKGIRMQGQVLYEMHIGAFTPEGTFQAAARELPALRELGITCIEVLPVAEFAGRFNWGYDGVDLFAPYHGYGDHEAFKRFTDAAHAAGLAVILDVVYNHFGPEGNYLPEFSPEYFTDRYENEWGRALNFDGEHSTPVRALMIDNAAYWIREFHLDGLRLDATQSLHDAGRPHVLAQICQAARRAAGARSIILIGENEPQHAQCLDAPQAGGFGLDALWNDDFHHSARVALTGSHDGYFHDYRGRAQEFISAVRHGFLFQGQRYAWQRKARGSPALDRPAHAFISYLQNHDQVANTRHGVRVRQLTSPGLYRAMTALLLLAPQTPMLFMGQEFGADEPFPFFADHEAELRAATREGRADFVGQFQHYATPEARSRLLDPGSPATFELAKLDFAQRRTHAPLYALHRDLLRLRGDDPVIARQDNRQIEGAVLGERAFLLRWLDSAAGDRLLLINLGADLQLSPIPEPLLAPPRASCWQRFWESDHPRYGGPGGIDPFETRDWILSAASATLYHATPAEG